METCIMLGNYKAYVSFDKYDNLSIKVKDEDDDLKELFELTKVANNVYLTAYGNTDTSEYMEFGILTEDRLDYIFKYWGSKLMDKHRDLLIKYVKMVSNKQGGKTI